jgi:poly(3-hydroxybutyrate) depolymerase
MRLRWLLALAVLLGLVTACTPTGRDDHLTVSGATVVAHVPSQATRTAVIVLHSLGHTWHEPVDQGWSTASDQHGFIAVYPDRGGSWNAGLCCGGAAAQGSDDVTWLESVVQVVRLKYGLTTVYFAGFSNGGMMVERLLAERPQLSSRFAVWGAAPEMPVAGHWTGMGSLYDGAGDTTVPWAGGTVTIGGVPVQIRPSQATGSWLIGARLHGEVIKGYGHSPAPNWPELAWRSLQR